MGLESECVAVIDEARFTGKLLLEGEELILRCKPTMRFKLNSLSSWKAVGNKLQAKSKSGPVCFQIDGDAQKWLDKIKNPPTRESKLGIKPTSKIYTVGTVPDEFAEVINSQVISRPTESDMILWFAESKSDLKRAKTVRSKLRSSSFIWVIYPKGVQIIRESDVFDALRAVGLKDTKVMSFSNTHTGHKFVVPLSDR